MNDQRHLRRRNLYGIIFLVSLCMLIVTAGGCQTLRRKFTRKKKGERESEAKFIPVLEPIDYEERRPDPFEKYKYHYSMFRVWERDLLQSIQDEAGDKRQEYLLGQMVGQLEEMAGLLNEATRPALMEIIEEMRGIEEAYDRPPAMRNTFSMRRTIERGARDVREQYAPDPEWFDGP